MAHLFNDAYACRVNNDEDDEYGDQEAFDIEDSDADDRHATVSSAPGPEQYETDEYWERPPLPHPLGRNNGPRITCQVVDIDYHTCECCL